jgi:hypothetical protein
MEIVGIQRFSLAWFGKVLGQQKAPRERGLVVDFPWELFGCGGGGPLPALFADI